MEVGKLEKEEKKVSNRQMAWLVLSYQASLGSKFP